MKKIKLIIMTLAIALSIGGAFATSPHVTQACQANPQYYYTGSGYAPAGTLGVNYICTNVLETCTYYKVGTNYVPCMSGGYCTANCKTSPKPPKTQN